MPNRRLILSAPGVSWPLLALLLSACTTFHHPSTGQTVTCQWQAEWGIGPAIVPFPIIPIPSPKANAAYRECKASARAAGYEAE